MFRNSLRLILREARPIRASSIPKAINSRGNLVQTRLFSVATISAFSTGKSQLWKLAVSAAAVAVVAEVKQAIDFLLLI
jgi:hypothetical protein